MPSLDRIQVLWWAQTCAILQMWVIISSSWVGTLPETHMLWCHTQHPQYQVIRSTMFIALLSSVRLFKHIQTETTLVAATHGYILRAHIRKCTLFYNVMSRIKNKLHIKCFTTCIASIAILSPLLGPNNKAPYQAMSTWESATPGHMSIRRPKIIGPAHIARNLLDRTESWTELVPTTLVILQATNLPQSLETFPTPISSILHYFANVFCNQCLLMCYANNIY